MCPKSWPWFWILPALDQSTHCWAQSILSKTVRWVPLELSPVDLILPIHSATLWDSTSCSTTMVSTTACFLVVALLAVEDSEQQPSHPIEASQPVMEQIFPHPTLPVP